MDSMELPNVFRPCSIDVVVSNPPYGVRICRGKDFEVFYARLLDSVGHVLRFGGVFGLLLTKMGKLRWALVKSKYRWLVLRRVAIGDWKK